MFLSSKTLFPSPSCGCNIPFKESKAEEILNYIPYRGFLPYFLYELDTLAKNHVTTKLKIEIKVIATLLLCMSNKR